SGTIRIAGTDTARISRRGLADFRRTQLGFIFQDSNLLDTLTARENVALPLTIGRVPADQILDSVEKVTKALGISDVLDKYPYQMSGGQRQRVACARALVTRPQLVLADEPTGALDSKNARLLLESLEAINRSQRATVLMVTHDETAASFCRRVLFIRDGKVFTEIRRGNDSRRAFFEKIMQVVAVQGGVDDAR
ncbi:MAG: ABC transporter ATP-binding protein, partial [Olsenella sp.]|nr:ABC transporter ATP-binding protein [Olsenella sp.]